MALPDRSVTPRKRDCIRSWLSGSPSADAQRSNLPLLSPQQPSLPPSSPPSPPPAYSSAFVTTGQNPASPGASARTRDDLAKQILHNVLEELTTEDRAIVEEYVLPGSADVSLVLQKAVNAVQAKRVLCESKRWTFTIAGREVVLKDEADKVLAWLKRFQSIGDVAVNADPLHAGLPWAAIRFLLEVATTERSQMTALLDGMQVTLYMMSRLNVYLDFCVRMSPKLARNNFEKGMTKLHALIFQFLANAIRIYSKSGRSRALTALWKPEEIATFQEKCEKLAIQVEIEAQNCDRELHAADSETTKMIHDTTQRLLKQIEELNTAKYSLDRIESNLSVLWSTIMQDRRSEILRWISPIPYLDNHNTAGKGWTEGTGSWIFNHPRFTEWDTSSRSMILWLHGIPGAGKTKLVWNIVDQLKRRPHDNGLAYFYCNRNEDERRETENVLRSFVRQLSVSQNHEAVQKTLLEKYEEKQKSGFASEKFSYEEAEALIPALSKVYTRITLVLDALDECCEGTRSRLISTFNSLIKQIPNLKILISSRCDSDIKFQLEKEANVGIGAAENDDDIQKFVRMQIEEDKQRRRVPLSEDLINEIVQTLHAKSNGMFQWASLQIAQILSLERERDIRERLGTLPRGLIAAYNEIYATILEQEGSRSQVARLAFQWLLVSSVPLHEDQLVAAICQDPDCNDILPIDIDIDFVLGACQNLLFVDQTGICRFSHLSVTEYLEENHPEIEEEGRLVAAKTCLLLLTHPRAYTIIWNKQEGPQWPMARLCFYARTEWPQHLRKIQYQPCDDPFFRMLREFFGSLHESEPSISYAAWHEFVREWSGIPTKLTNQLRQQFFYMSPPEMAAFSLVVFGLERVLYFLSDENFDPNQTNSRGESLLSLAVLYGHEAIVQQLLNRGADVNAAKPGAYGTPLLLAVRGNNLAIANLLISHGAELKTFLKQDDSVLWEAASGGHTQMAKLLIDSGANVDQLSRSSTSALEEAAANGYIAIVKLLLDHGADINLRTRRKQGGSALTVAAARGHTAMVQLLIEKGADINMKLQVFPGNALCAAVYSHWGNSDIIRALVSAGADIHAQPMILIGNALIAAVTTGYLEKVKLLIELGADVNARPPGRFGTALGAAASTGNIHIAKYLLDNGADVNTPGDSYSPYAEELAEQDFAGVVDALRRVSVKVKFAAGQYGSPLTEAAAYGRIDMVRLLLDHGADVNAQGGEYGTPLGAAMANRRAKTIKLLLERGAKPEAEGSRTPKAAPAKGSDLSQPTEHHSTGSQTYSTEE